MKYSEHAVVFGCGSERLVGIVTLPGAAQPASPTDSERAESPAMGAGVVIVVGGPQYRAGSHRQFVLLARALATSGTPVLRFDYRGMGDSSGALHTFENVNDDIACAINTLHTAVPGLPGVVLWGLCDGASAALLYCHATQDTRVQGLCLLNPWVRSPASLAKTQVKHYYTERLRQKEFWLKLLSGKVAGSAVRGLARAVKAAFSVAPQHATGGLHAPFQTRMALAWRQLEAPILLLLSGSDYTAKEFLEYAASDAHWSGALDQSGLVRQDLQMADHTFSDPVQRQQVELLCAAWLGRIPPV